MAAIDKHFKEMRASIDVFNETFSLEENLNSLLKEPKNLAYNEIGAFVKFLQLYFDHLRKNDQLVAGKRTL